MPERPNDARAAETVPALAIDLYQLTMAQSYLREGLLQPAVFSLYFRTLPATRNFVLACGLEDALAYLETLRFEATDLDVLARHGSFRDEFLRWLESFRFRGSVWAMPEGTPVFADEPLIEIEASLPEAQLVETIVMNQVHLQSVLASKAARVVAAAAGRSVIEFGMRRMHGLDAATKAVRAFNIAGVDATSNVAAGNRYGVPVTGTMAHSYVQAHDDEATAFREMAALYPETVLLVDAYDTLAGVRHVIDLARALGSDFRVRGIRLDSGDLEELSREARALLDGAGLEHVRIIASGGLDEIDIASLVAREAPIDAFGVGTRMGASADAPTLEMAYKLTEYAGRGRLKLSPGKRMLPGRKQVFRRERTAGGAAQGPEARIEAIGDVVAAAGEALEGRPLLSQVMVAGERTPAGRVSLSEARLHARDEVAKLPAAVRALAPADPGYPVAISERLLREAEAVARAVTGK